MFTLVAHYETIDAAGVFANLTRAPGEVHIGGVGDDIQVPSLNQLLAVAAGVGSGGTGFARVDAPSFMGGVSLRIAPINGNADGDAEPNSPPAILDLRRTPIVLQPGEDLRALVDSNPTNPQANWVIYLLGDGPVTPLTGVQPFTIRMTATAALVVDTWTAQEMTLTDRIPTGRYQIIGMRARSAGLVAARLVRMGGSPWRPGCLGHDADTDLTHPMFDFGGLGVWGEFPESNIPAVEFLSVSADTDQEVWLDIVGPF